jgi:hypothetical protein
MAHRSLYLFSVIAAALVLPVSALRAQAGANVEMQLAVTFSDAPGADGKLFSGKEQTERLLEALKKGNIKEAAFYINPSKLSEPGAMDRVKAYAAGGHKLGLYVPVAPSSPEFIAEFKKGHEVVSKLPNFFASVRYPVAKDPKQDVVPGEAMSALSAAGYTVGYYTVSGGDARMNQMLQRAIEERKPINWDYLRDVFLRLHVESMQFYDQLGNVVTNNRIANHVLILHENDLVARYMLGLIVQARRMGSDFVTVSEAFKDPVAQMMPKQSPQARTIGLALDRQGARALYPERGTDEGMDKMVEFFNAFTGKR